MKTYTFFLMSLFTLFLSCKEKEKEISSEQKKVNLNIDLEKTKELINLQKNANFEDFRPEKPYKPTEKDLLALIPFVEEGLKNAGYKTLSNDEFELQIKDIVKGNKIKNYDAFTTLFLNTLDRKAITLNEHEFDFDLTDNQFAVKNYNFMIPMLFLEDVIKIKKDNSYDVAVPDYIIARNRYLFNNSKEDLDWLLVNDKDFLESLVISLGYDKEPRINKLLLEHFYKMFTEGTPIEDEKIGTLFFTKDLNSNFCVRQGLINYVENTTKVSDNRLLYALSNYCFVLYQKDWSEKFGSDSPFKMFNAVEKAHIVSIVASMEVPAIEKYKPENPELWNNAGSALYDLLVAHPEIKDIIMKNNYFGIENMKQVLEDTVDEIYINDFKRNNKNDDDE